jgi:hypothetical protein
MSWWKRLWGRTKKAPPAAPPAPPQSAAPGPEYWVDRLTERLARLHRLQELRAPRTIIDTEKQLVREAIALLPPAEALCVIRQWPSLVHHLDPKAARPAERLKKDPSAAPN